MSTPAPSSRDRPSMSVSPFATYAGFPASTTGLPALTRRFPARGLIRRGSAKTELASCALAARKVSIPVYGRPDQVKWDLIGPSGEKKRLKFDELFSEPVCASSSGTPRLPETRLFSITLSEPQRTRISDPATFGLPLR